MSNHVHYEATRLPIIRWKWWLGIPRDFWILNREIIGAFIDQAGLQSIPREHLVFDDPVPIAPADAAEAENVERRIRWPKPFPGGLKIAHLHYKGEIFELNQEQWANFSAQIVKGFSTKLQEAGTVRFEKLIELSDAVDSLT